MIITGRSQKELKRNWYTKGVNDFSLSSEIFFERMVSEKSLFYFQNCASAHRQKWFFQSQLQRIETKLLIWFSSLFKCHIHYLLLYNFIPTVLQYLKQVCYIISFLFHTFCLVFLPLRGSNVGTIVCVISLLIMQSVSAYTIN